MVSVIIPTYNRETTIQRSIESVINQTYKDIEIIVVDDCSTDTTEKLVSGIKDERIKYYKLLNRSGACAARNYGIEHSNGDYVAFQDSDDEWIPNKLEIQLENLNRYNADICISSMLRFGHKNNVELFPHFHDGILEYRTLLTGFYVSTQTILCKHEILNEVKFDPNVKRMQDLDWGIRAAEKYVLCTVEEPLVKAYLQPDSITNGTCSQLKNVYLYLIDKYSLKMKQYPELYEFLHEQLEIQKTLAGEDVTSDLYILFSKTKKIKYAIKFVMWKMGVLKAYYRYKNY